MRTFIVTADWDDEAQVWVVASDDIPGLVTEAETIELVTEKLRDLVPDLLRENGVGIAGGEVPVEIVTRRTLSLDAA